MREDPGPLDNIGGEVLDDSAVERAASVDRPRSCIAVAEIDPSSFAASFHAVQPGANGPWARWLSSESAWCHGYDLDFCFCFFETGCVSQTVCVLACARVCACIERTCM